MGLWLGGCRDLEARCGRYRGGRARGDMGQGWLPMSRARSAPGYEIEGGLGAALGVARRGVKRVAGNHEQFRVPDRLLPCTSLLDRGEPAAVGGDDQGGTGDLRQV